MTKLKPGIIPSCSRMRYHRAETTNPQHNPLQHLLYLQWSPQGFGVVEGAVLKAGVVSVNTWSSLLDQKVSPKQANAAGWDALRGGARRVSGWGRWCRSNGLPLNWRSSKVGPSHWTPLRWSEVSTPSWPGWTDHRAQIALMVPRFPCHLRLQMICR